VHADKMFLSCEPWSEVVRWLHHRIYDVSAIKEAARRFASVEVLRSSPRKQGLHEAKADILESIEEARWQRDVFFTTAVVAAKEKSGDGGGGGGDGGGGGEA
jgi:oligoribonuclease